MKGISHGACHYLLKPVTLEELKNIWQHVVRRKKFDLKEKNKTSNGKLNKKRKDQDDKEDEDEEENDHDNEDPSAQKKPRVVWSVELQRKKAVPKKILDLMNVEKLTRENVASHLQKYRLYLKRISCVANQQANMAAALGSADPSYLRMGSVSGVGHLQTLSDSGQLHNNAFGSFPPSGMISRLISPLGLNVHGFPSSGVLPLGQSQNLINSTNDQLKFQSAIVPVNQNGVQGMPVSVGLDQLQQNKSMVSVQNLTPVIDATTTLPISNKLPDLGPRVTPSGSHTPSLGNNALMLEAHPQHTLGGTVYQNSSPSATSQLSEVSFFLPDQGRYGDNWSSAVQPSEIQAKSYPPSECFRQTCIPSRDNVASLPLQWGNLGGPSSVTSLCGQPHTSMTDLHSQGVRFTNRPGLMSSNVPLQDWDDHNQYATYHSNVICSSIKSLSPVNGVVGPLGHTPTNSNVLRKMDFNFCDPLQMKRDGVMELTEETSLQQHQGNILNPQKSLQ